MKFEITITYMNVKLKLNFLWSQIVVQPIIKWLPRIGVEGQFQSDLSVSKNQISTDISEVDTKWSSKLL